MTDEMTGMSSNEFGATWCRLFIMDEECLLAAKKNDPNMKKNPQTRDQQSLGAQSTKYRGSYKSVHVLLNLLNELGKRDTL